MFQGVPSEGRGVPGWLRSAGGPARDFSMSVNAWLRKLPKTPLPAWLSRWGLFPVLSVIRDLGSLRFLSFGVIPLVKGLEFSHQVFVTEESLHVCPILIFAGWHTELVEVHIHE